MIFLKKLCIFDFDGTLAYTMDNIAFYVNKTLSEYSISPIDTDTIQTFVGNGARELIKCCLRFSKSAEDIDEVLTRYLNHYDSDPSYLVEIYDGVFEMLNELKSSGYDIAVLSNKPHSSTSLIIEKLFPKYFFYKYLGKREKFKTKPNPEAVNYIANGYSKEHCFFIGDSDTDILTGKNAEMKTIGVTWGFRSEDVLKRENPTYIAHNPEEVTAFILQK